MTSSRSQCGGRRSGCFAGQERGDPDFMVAPALNVAAEQVIEHSTQSLYRTADVDEFDRADCCVAIAVTTNRQWEALRNAIGRPGWAMDPELADDADRCARHHLIDEGPAAWCLPRTRDAIIEARWTAGVPVAKVMQPHRQTELPQLRHRRFFEHVGSLGQGCGVAPTGEIAALEDDDVIGTAPATGGRRKATR